MWTEDPRSGLVTIPGFGDTASCTYSYRLGRRYRWGDHHHAEHELLWVSSGPVSVIAGDRHWWVPPTMAIWLPSGVVHAVECDASSDISCVFLAPEHCGPVWIEPTTMPVDGLTRELILELDRTTVDADARRRLEGVLLDRLAPARSSPMELPLPADPRARAVALALAADVSDGRSLAAWGREVGASVRTLARGFRAGTGLSFVQWRTHARVRASLSPLLGGESVTAVAATVGYDSAGSFAEAFRTVTGCTPRAFANARAASVTRA